MTEHLFGANASDRLNPSFREEDQEMASELKPIVMAPPAYASPDPATQGARLVPVEESPHDLSDDYGADVLSTPSDTEVVATDYYDSTRTPEEGQVREGAAKAAKLDDEDRDSWAKADWQAKSRSYGLAVGGTVNDLRERVEAYEGELEADNEMTAAEWVEEVGSAKSADDLAAVRERYGAADADYSTVESAFEKKQAEFDAADES